MKSILFTACAATCKTPANIKIRLNGATVASTAMAAFATAIACGMLLFSRVSAAQEDGGALIGNAIKEFFQNTPAEQGDVGGGGYRSPQEYGNQQMDAQDMDDPEIAVQQQQIMQRMQMQHNNNQQLISQLQCKEKCRRAFGLYGPETSICEARCNVSHPYYPNAMPGVPGMPSMNSGAMSNYVREGQECTAQGGVWMGTHCMSNSSYRSFYGLDNK